MNFKILFRFYFKPILNFDTSASGWDFYPVETLTLSKDVKFKFTDNYIYCIGSDVKLKYPRNRVAAFEAGIYL